MPREHSSNLFLLELLFSIFFFIIVSTICLQVFAKSHNLNLETKNMNKALELIQNEVEFFYTDSSFSSSSNSTYYDGNWKTCTFSEASFEFIKQYSVDEHYTYLTSSVISLNDNSILYSLSVKVYNQESVINK